MIKTLSNIFKQDKEKFVIPQNVQQAIPVQVIWEDGIFQIGKNSLTPENTAAIEEALEARELIKVSVLQNCMDDPKELAAVVSERTRSQVVQVIGKKIVLYKEGRDEKKKIVLPR